MKLPIGLRVSLPVKQQGLDDDGGFFSSLGYKLILSLTKAAGRSTRWLLTPNIVCNACDQPRPPNGVVYCCRGNGAGAAVVRLQVSNCCCIRDFITFCYNTFLFLNRQFSETQLSQYLQHCFKSQIVYLSIGKNSKKLLHCFI